MTLRGREGFRLTVTDPGYLVANATDKLSKNKTWLRQVNESLDEEFKGLAPGLKAEGKVIFVSSAVNF